METGSGKVDLDVRGTGLSRRTPRCGPLWSARGKCSATPLCQCASLPIETSSVLPRDVPKRLLTGGDGIF